MDKELVNIFKHLSKETHLDVVLDCCYSGSAAKDIDDDISENEYNKVRGISPEIDYEDLVQPTFNRMLDTKNMKVVMKEDINYIVWSACKEDQKATEKYIEATGVRGIFTYYFCNELIKHPQITRKELDNRLTKLVTNLVKTQTPLLQYFEDGQLDSRVLR